MKSFNIIYNKHVINGMSFESEKIPVLWPVLAYNIVLQVRKPSVLNVFERSVLSLCKIKLCNHEILSDLLCLPLGFIKIIVQSLNDKRLLAKFSLTAEGNKMLDESLNIESENQKAVVFRDCLSGELLPHIEKEIVSYSGRKNNNEIVFNINNNQQIRGFEIKYLQKKKFNFPTLGDILEVIKLSNILKKEDLSKGEELNTKYLENSSINICRFTPKQVYLYTEVCKSNNSIFVTDPFHNTDSPIFQKDFKNIESSNLDEIAKKISGENLDLNLDDYQDNSDSTNIILKSYNNFDYLLRPIMREKEDNKEEEKLNDNKIIERIVDFQNALEQAFMIYLKPYNIKNIIRSLVSVSKPEVIKDFFSELAFNKIGFTKNWNTEKRLNIDETLDSSCLICKYSGNFFKISGGHFNNILRNEGNLKELFAITLSLHQKEYLKEINKLVKEFPDLICFLEYINSNKNYGLHGENIFNLPTKEQLEVCRLLTIKIISILLNKHNLEEETEEAEYYDIPIEEYRKNLKKANFVLQKQDFGYGRLQRLPENIRNSLYDLTLHCLLKKDVKQAFYYIQRTLDVVFAYVLDIVLNNEGNKKGIFDGKRVLEIVNKKYPDLPSEFTAIKANKLTSTLQGRKCSFRANLLCLMALSDNLKFLDNKNYIQTLKTILEVRTHNIVDSLKNVEQNEIYSLKNDVVSIINLLLKEHYL